MKIMRYFWPMKPAFFFTTLAVVFLSTIIATYTIRDKSSCQIDFEFEASKPVDFDIYYDVGRGMNQEDHQSKFIAEENTRTAVSFCIPMYSQLRHLRFDPATEPVTMKIHRIHITYSDGTTYNVPFDTLLPNNQISKLDNRNSVLAFETVQDASDPTFSFTKLGKDIDNVSRAETFMHYLLWIGGAILMVFAGRFVGLYFFWGV